MGDIKQIIGNTTATPNPRPDWNQTDETKADYIKNKPITVCVEGGAKPLEEGIAINKGDTITFKWDNFVSVVEATGSNSEKFYFQFGWFGNEELVCGWNIEGNGGQHFVVPLTDTGEYSYVYNGNSCTVQSVTDSWNNAYHITVSSPTQATYEKDGEKKQLDLSMLTDTNGLLGQGGGGSTGGENPKTAVYIEEGEEKPFEVGLTLNKGDIITFKWDNIPTYMFTAKGSSGEYFYFGAYIGGDDNITCGWNTEQAPSASANGQHFSTTVITKGEMSYVYNGKSCSITEIQGYENYLDVVVTPNKKAVYEENGETKQVDFSMLAGQIDVGKVLGIRKNIPYGDIISFSMQGYSHFQILSANVGTNNNTKFTQMLGMVAKKTDWIYYGCGHIEASSNFWSNHIVLPMNYDEKTDSVFLDTKDTLITDTSGARYLITLYIKLFNVEGA